MALGMTYGGGGNENIVPVVKYDARAGRLTRVDRTIDGTGGYVTTNVDITNTFKAVLDMENIEVGYLKFKPGVAPEFMLVPHGQKMPDKPADTDFKQGARFMLKLHASCGGDIREMAGTAAAFMRGFDQLHTDYEAGKAANPGKLPIVTLVTTEAVTTGSGQTKSTNYQPQFAIAGWAPRPSDLVFIPKMAGEKPAAAQEKPAEKAAAPSTGSTVVGATQAKTEVKTEAKTEAKPAAATAGADDFG
jgi:hypothetical protein